MDSGVSADAQPLHAREAGDRRTDIDRVQDLLKQAGFLGWRNFWLEAACWDIKGKAAGKPVYELFGGTPRPLPVYLSTGEVHPPEQRVDELLAMMERGYGTAKLRVKSPDLAEDIRQIEIVRKGVGDDLVLGVDANQGWLVSIVDRVPAWDLRVPRQRVLMARGAARLARLRRPCGVEEGIEGQDRRRGA
ncbi:MAG: hypothetical protein JRF48_13705 [Deltaproteobacteria bacterium]|nr:hypothetical protein [Deltaproteobacteria bacterium]